MKLNLDVIIYKYIYNNLNPRLCINSERTEYTKITLDEILEEFIDDLDCDVIEFVEWCKAQSIDYRKYVDMIME